MPWAPPVHGAQRTKARRDARQREYNKTSRRNQSFYDSPAWRKLRKWFARQNPVCVECRDEGIARTLDVVDHIVPIEQGGARLDPANLQALCNRHHNQKTARER